MIRNWKQKQLNIDYSRLNFGRGQPSDIDFMYRGRNHILLLGEIKNERGTFTDWQRKMYEDIADNYKGHCIILYITHNKRVEDGDTRSRFKRGDGERDVLQWIVALSRKEFTRCYQILLIVLEKKRVVTFVEQH